MAAAILNYGLQWLLRYAAARELGAARHDGGYELLLTTPLLPSDIVWGELEALRVQFRPILRFVLGLEGAWMLLGLTARSWTPSALLTWLIIWCWLLDWVWHLDRRWRAVLMIMWASVNCGHPGRALWRAHGLGPILGMNLWLWLWIGFNWNKILAKSAAFPTGSVVEVGLVMMVTLVIFLVRERQPHDANHWESRLVAELREIVREPVPDPDSRRFKQWNYRERFPWGWGVWRHQLHERLARR